MRVFRFMLLLGYLLCGGASQLFAQLSPDSLHARAQELYKAGEYEEALPWLEQATQGYLANLRWEEWTDVLSTQAGCYAGLGQYQEIIPILVAAIDTLTWHLGPDHKLVGSVCNDLGSLYSALEDCEAAMPLLQQALAIRRRVLAPDNPSLGTTLINLSTCAEHSEGLEASNRYLEEALHIWERAYGPEDARLAKIYNNLGWNHGQLGLFDAQLAYYQQVVTLREKALDSLHPQLAGGYINLGIAYYARAYYAEALAYTQKAEAVYRYNDQQNPYLLAHIYNNYAAIYESLNDHPKARTYLWQMLETDLGNLGAHHFYVGVSYYNLAEHYTNSGEIAAALQYIREALRIFEPLAEGDQGSYQLNYAKALTRAGHIYLALGQTRTALQMVEAAEQAFAASGTTYGNIISTLVPLRVQVYEALQRPEAARAALTEAITFWGERPRAAESYIALGEMELRLARPQAAQAAFDAAAAVLTAAGQAEEDPQMLKALTGQAEARYRQGSALAEALAISQQAAQLIATWRRRAYTPEALAQHLQEAARIYEIGLHAAWTLYQQDPQATWLEQAFALSEQGKATLLYQGLRQGEALRTGDIPAATLDKERQLRLDRAFYQRKVYEATEADSLRLKNWRQQLFRLNRAHEALIAEIEARYPRFYQLKYAAQTASIGEVQAFLAGEKAAALCYVTGQAHSYLFLLAPDTVAFLRLPPSDSIQAQVEHLRHLVLREGLHQGDDDTYQARFDSLCQVSHQLYQAWVAPATRSYTLPPRLMIIPDGSLGYLSFDLLLTAAPQSGAPLPYFIRTHTLSYAYSATLMQYQPQAARSPDQRGVLAIAPAFGQAAAPGTRGGWTSLQHNQAEAELVQALMGGTLVTGSKAREGLFRTQAPRFSLLHLSSHAQVDDANPLFSRVAFAPAQDSSEDGQLDLAEIFALQLDAEMVVLSACETGMGRLMRGEGIASLARGFASAGARSIITTLWPVNDAATAAIMEDFYRGLKEGLHKDAALRQAKLRYLDQSDRLGMHPFFWAGYIPVGDMQPLRRSSWPWYSLGVLLLLGSLTLGLWQKKKRGQGRA